MIEFYLKITEPSWKEDKNEEKTTRKLVLKTDFAEFTVRARIGNERLNADNRFVDFRL